MFSRHWIASSLLLASIVAIAVGLTVWKTTSLAKANAAAANQPEPVESVMVAIAHAREHRPTTTAIGTIVALRSITLRNEIAGTVRLVRLNPGDIVEAGTVLVGLDVSVEQAELKALEAQAELAKAMLARVEKMRESHAISEMELDRARAEYNVALAQVARTEAIVARKTIRAPFRARVGISDVHPGQYLNEGTQLTTLQGVEEAAYVDFLVAQHVAALLRKGATVDVFAPDGASSTPAAVVAIDARVDANTRNALVRARIEANDKAPAPGASVRVAVPVGPLLSTVTVPVSALRKGPSGDHVFVLEPDAEGKVRARVRQVIAGTVLGDEVSIEKGLTAGDRVAASGSFKLRESALVVVVNSSSSAAPSGG